MHPQAITSLAILKVNWDRGLDYIDNFVPFIAESLRNAPQPEVSMAYLQQAMIDSFGLRIPQGALKTILKRTVKRGYAEKSNRVFRRKDRALEKLELSRTRADVLRQHEGLVQKLVRFCRDQYQIEWSEEQASTALLSYIYNRSAPLLASAVEGAPDLEPIPLVKHSEFLVSKFTLELFHNDPEGFKFLETIVKGSILASTVFYPDLGQIQQHFEATEIYFDTPFLLRAIGSAGPNFQSACREVIELLYQQNATLRCFQHTRDEMWGVLDAAAHALRRTTGMRGPVGETIEYFISLKYQPSDVELILARLDKVLQALHIEVRPRPAYKVALGLDEAALEKALRDEVHYRYEGALLHDLNSLTAIYRIRRGETYPRIESCRALFLTTNANLAKASRKFFRANNTEPGGSAPACVLDDFITTLVWLKNPATSPQLPRQRIIADCYAALNPPDDLWRKYLNEINRLQQAGNISDDDFHLLRFSSEARDVLMDLTFGDEDTFVIGTVEEVLEKAKAAARADTKASLEKEKQMRAEAERQISLTEKRSESQLLAIRLRIEQLSSKAGLWTSRVVFLAGIAVLAAGLYYTFPDRLPRSLLGWTKLIPPTLLAGSLAFSLWHLAYGTSLRSLTRQLEIRITHIIEKTLRRQFLGEGGVTPDSSAGGYRADFSSTRQNPAAAGASLTR
jgi:hypothetical protein